MFRILFRIVDGDRVKWMPCAGDTPIKDIIAFNFGWQKFVFLRFRSAFFFFCCPFLISLFLSDIKAEVCGNIVDVSTEISVSLFRMCQSWVLRCLLNSSPNTCNRTESWYRVSVWFRMKVAGAVWNVIDNQPIRITWLINRSENTGRFVSRARQPIDEANVFGGAGTQEGISTWNRQSFSRLQTFNGVIQTETSTKTRWNQRSGRSARDSADSVLRISKVWTGSQVLGLGWLPGPVCVCGCFTVVLQD